MKWWQKDRFGYPIETVLGHQAKNFLRIVLQNIRKVVG